ncbi:MAG: hypoxanthine phosphoribosyltransferase [Oscillospiraceae bacterium]|nr:hypoxanthine phosphoribosyltransferase [Oscillospiraceae bacterium]
MKFETIEDYKKNTVNVVVSEEKIREAVKKTGQSLNEIYDGTPLLLVSVLKGSFVFLADLCREITIPCEIGFMAAKSYYEGTSSTGEVDITMDLQQDISKYHVVIVEDIIDSGRTLKSIVERLKSRNPMSLRVITLLDKPSRREVDFNADVSLFTIPDLFVVGYGLDYAEYYRNLPYVACIEE